MSALHKSAPEPTPEQARAADPAVSAWVSANAGSGKTHVLVERVLRLLLSGIDPARILCLTFTRAAASEMANRIFNRLAQWAAADDAALRPILALADGGRADDARLAFARTLFARALETPGGLKIQTIHAFCERVLHQFAFEANVTAHFQVLDPAMSADLRARAIAATLADATADNRLSGALDDIAGLAGEQRFFDLIGAVVAARQPLDAWTRLHGGLDQALAQLRANLAVAAGDDADALMHDWLASPHLPPSLWRETANALLAGASVTDQQRGADLMACISTGDDALRLAWYKRFLLTASGAVRKAIGTKSFAKAHAGLAAAIERELVRASELVARERALEVFTATSALLRLGATVIQRLEALKMRSGLLDYDDLIQRTLALLSRQNAAPWVLYKLDGGIDHMLVDEAQDTNPEQWQIVQRLAEEFFAGEGARAGLRTIFAVGDEKQSIYSFQGAEPAAFERMRRFFAARVSHAGRKFERVSLIVSFRSVPTVLRAVDEVFRLEVARHGLGEDSETIVHTALREADPGVVELWPLHRPAAREETPAWDAPLDRPSPDHPRLRLASAVAQEVARLLAGEAIVDNGTARAIVPADVLILVRRRNDLVDALIAALRRSAIPVAGADRLVLGEHLAVQDLMAAADVALLPQDDLSLAAVLKGPLIGMGEDELFNLAWQRPATLWAALGARTDMPGCARARGRIAGWMTRADAVRPFEFFSAILTQERGRLALLERLGPEAADAVDEFLCLALSFEEMGPASLQGFLHWMRGQSIDIKRNMEEGHGAVRIMTVHGAKGLEAPVVFLVDTCEVPTRRLVGPLLPLDRERGAVEGLAWRTGKAETLPHAVGAALERAMDVQMAEYRRLLYVAMTRARDRLYVCGALGDKSREPAGDSWYALVEQALAPMMQTVEVAGAQRLRLGAPPPAVSLSERAPAPAMTLLPAWLSQPAPAGEAVSKTLAPSRIEIALPDTAGAQGELAQPSASADLALARGTYVHRLLELLPGIADSERAAAAMRLAGVLLPDTDAATCQDWAREALALLAHPDLLPLFSVASIGEVSVAGQIGHHETTGEPILISGQIDRLAVLEDEVLVADYKTNRSPPLDAQDTPRTYLAQLAAYRAALAPQFPGRRLRFFLIWTANADVMEIKAELLDSALVDVLSGRTSS